MSDISEGRPLPLAGSLAGPLRWMNVLGSIPLVITVGVLVVAFARAPAGQAPPLFLLFLVPGLVLAMHLMLVRSIARASVRIEQGELVVHTGLGRKCVPLSRLRKHGVRVVDLNQHKELKPFWRSWGTGLPGFTAGWFRLRNGERAVCLLLARDRVTYLRDDVEQLSLLLSLADPDALRARLQR